MNITGKIMIGNTASAVHILYKDMFGCSLRERDVPGAHWMHANNGGGEWKCVFVACGLEGGKKIPSEV